VAILLADGKGRPAPAVRRL